MTFDPQPWRADTPAALGGRIHLNNAGASLMPAPVVDAVLEHLQREVHLGGYEAADAAASEIDEAYASIATLLNAEPRNIAVAQNATVAFDLALSSFQFNAGDVLITTRNDYISNQIAYNSLAHRIGLRVVRADDLAEGGVDPDSVRALVAQHKPRLVALTWIPTNSGLIQDAIAVGEICRDADVPYLVDACQAVGQLPVDVRALHCDFLAATARKFMRGPRGIGFLYVSDDALRAGRQPLYLDMRGATWVDADRFDPVPDAKRFENWESASALVLGMGAAARYALRVGVAESGAYAASLAQYAREKLAEMPNARVLDRGAARCAITTVHFPGYDAREIMLTLREEAINTTATLREYAVIDMDEKRVPDALRISPHYYNTKHEVDIAISALAAWGDPR